LSEFFFIADSGLTYELRFTAIYRSKKLFQFLSIDIDVVVGAHKVFKLINEVVGHELQHQK
jgi:hypothetical protein